MKKVIFYVVALFLFSFCLSAQAEVRKVELSGKKLDAVFSDNFLPYMGAVTFAVPEESRRVRPYIKGLTRSSNNSQIYGDSAKPAVTTNVPRRRIRVRKVKINGKIKGKLSYVDTAFLVKVLKSQADYYYTKNKTLSGSIGTSDDYKVVVMDGAKLTLNKNFKGYGILILTGSSKTKQRLLMENKAKWYGLIISDIGSDYKESLGAIITIGSKTSSGTVINPFIKLIDRTRKQLAALFINSAFARSRRGRPIGPLPPIPGPLPVLGAKAEVQGAIIIAGAKPQLQVGYADIRYAKDYIDRVNKKFSTLNFVWQNWREKE